MRLVNLAMRGDYSTSMARLVYLLRKEIIKYFMLAFKIKNILKKSNLVMSCYEGISSQFRAFLYTLSPTLLVMYFYLKQRGMLPDLKKPESFDEKLLWLILYWRHPLKSQCADKYAMRSFVEKNGMGHILPPIIGVYNDSSEINFDSLPERFVLKCTHGCGFNILCRSKHDLDWDEAKRKLNSWMKVDLSKVCGNIHYASIKPRIVCEHFLEDSSGDIPNDYKVFCFAGKAHCIMACTERGSDERTKFDFYDLGWKEKLPYSKTSLLANRNIPKPAAYEEMIKSAEILSRPFPFVRMDFYSINGKAILGEMTFTPNGGVDTYLTERAQQELGEMIELPEKILK